MKNLNSKLFDSKRINDKMSKVIGGQASCSGSTSVDTVQSTNYDVVSSTGSTTSAPTSDSENTGSCSSKDAPCIKIGNPIGNPLSLG